MIGCVLTVNGGQHYIVKDITTNQVLDAQNIETKINVYEKQVNQWFLDQAENLVHDEKN
jgi:hypothetical protein